MVLNVAPDVVETISAHTPFCVIKNVRIIWIVQRLEDVAVMVIVPNRLYVKEIKLPEIIVIHQANALPDIVANHHPLQISTMKLGQIAVKFIHKKIRNQRTYGPTFSAP